MENNIVQQEEEKNIINIKWKEGLNAQGSAWKIRSITLFENNLLVLGAVETIPQSPTQLYFCNTSNLKWKSGELKGDDIGPNYYSSITSEDNNFIYIIWPKPIIDLNKSDQQSDSTRTLQESNIEAKSTTILAFNKLNLQRMTWESIIPTGDELPRARKGFTIVGIQSKIYLFGGVDDENKPLNDLFILDVHTNKWEKCECNDKPSPRSNYAITVFDDKYIIVHGGQDGSLYYNDMHIFSIEKQSWIKVLYKQEENDIPDARANHSLHISKGHAIIFGGTNGISIFNDTKVLNLNTFTWLKNIEMVGDVPTGRYNHFTKNISNDIAVVFGGNDGKSQLFDIYFLNTSELPNQEIIEFKQSHCEEELITNKKIEGMENEGMAPSYEYNEDQPIIEEKPEITISSPIDHRGCVLNIEVKFEGHVFSSTIDNMEEMQVLQDVFHFIEENNFVSTREFLKLCRYCKILSNSVDWNILMSVLKKNLAIQDWTQADLAKMNFNQFKQILCDLSVKRYRDNNQSVLSCLRYLVFYNIQPYYKRVKRTDIALDQLMEPIVLNTLTKYRKSLQEVYGIFCSLGLMGKLPTWKEIEKHEMTISLAEILSFAQSFELTPSLIPRHVLSKRIIPLSTSDCRIGDNISLNFPEFVESIGRMALFIYSRFPYSNLMKSAEQKVAAIIVRMGLYDKKKYSIYLKEYGLLTEQRTFEKPKQKIPDPEILLKDKEKLKDELKRIFMYYCSFGDHLNLDLMSSAKFSKFVRDIKLLGLKPEEVDLLYVKTMKQYCGSQYSLSDEKAQKMTFPIFVESLKLLATKIYAKETPSKALVKLLSENVLPNATRMPEIYTNININDEQVQSLLKKYKKMIQQFHSIYCSHNDAKKLIQGFLLMGKDFGIVPELISKADIYKIFRSMFLDIVHEEMSREEFEQCLVRVAMIAFSKHPYNEKYPTIGDKVLNLFIKLGMNDWNATKKRLEYLGRRIQSPS